MYLDVSSAEKIHVHQIHQKVKEQVNICQYSDHVLRTQIVIGSLPTPPLGHSASSISLVGPKYPQTAMRIADQVIEEVDEQLTVTSNRGYEKRPTAQSLFASSNGDIPARSAPIDVPGSYHNNDKINYERIQSVAQEHSPYLFPSNEIFSSSAPEENCVHLQTPKIHVNEANESKVGTPGSTKDGNNGSVHLCLKFPDSLQQI